MTADDLMRLINRYVEACDDLGNGLFEKPLTTTDALHAKATALHGQILDEVYRLHALAAAQPPAAMPVPTGWICRHKQQVADAEKVFPGQPHDYLWKYTHGTRDMAECEGYGDFDVVRLYATPQAQSVPATGAQPRRVPNPITASQLFDLVQEYGPQDDSEATGYMDGFRAAERHHEIGRAAMLAGASPTAPTGSEG